MAHYFNRACILPSFFFNNKPPDLQDRYKEYILLAHKEWTDETDCSLEIVLTDEETKRLNQSDCKEFFLAAFPIPISRIRKIYFKSEEQQRTTVWNINNGTAFIPNHILEVVTKPREDRVIKMTTINISVNKNYRDISKMVAYFDSILGGFAFMRTATSDLSINYPKRYFPTLGYFSSLIMDRCNDIEREKKEVFNSYRDLFDKNENDDNWKKYRAFLRKEIRDIEVINRAEEEGISIKKQFGKIDLNSLNKNSYIYDLAVLATYGKNKSKQISDLVFDVHNSIIPRNKAERIMLLFGINTKYSNLRNQYKVNEGYKSVKFNLESKLDYYIIESIYQVIFNKKRENYIFPYIDEWCPNLEDEDSKPDYKTFKILDNLITYQKRYPFCSPSYYEELASEYSLKKDVVQSLIERYKKDEEKEFPKPVILNKEKEESDEIKNVTQTITPKPNQVEKENKNPTKEERKKVLGDLKVPDLKKYLKKLGATKYSKLNKPDLIEKILETELNS